MKYQLLLKWFSWKDIKNTRHSNYSLIGVSRNVPYALINITSKITTTFAFILSQAEMKKSDKVISSSQKIGMLTIKS